MRLWPLVGLALASSAWAQVEPVPSREDPRVQTVRYIEDQPVRLQTSAGDRMTIMFAPGERIATINISNSAVYQATLSDARDSFVLNTSMVLDQGSFPRDGTISIITDLRRYQLMLSAAGDGSLAPYVLRFTYARSDSKRAGQAGNRPSYRLKGNKDLRPASIRDDGAKTYIQWSREQAIPAVFALDRLGREEMVDGYMRDGVFTVDRVHDRLVFRIDDARAEAQRSHESARP